MSADPRSPIVPTASPGPLTQAARAFLDAPRFAVVATVRPDGRSHQAVVWYLFEGSTLTVNSAPHRRWPSDLRRDPRIGLMIEDGARYVAAYGTAEIDDDQTRAQADIAAMARRYHPDEPDLVERMVRTQFQRQQRVSFRFIPERIHAVLEGEG